MRTSPYTDRNNRPSSMTALRLTGNSRLNLAAPLRALKNSFGISRVKTLCSYLLLRQQAIM